MITSVHNPKIQAIRKLQTRGKHRAEEQAFVIEGVRLAEEAYQAGWPTRQVLFTEQLDERGKALVDRYSAQGVHVEQVTDAIFRTISETETPQGVLAVLAMKPMALPESPNFLLVLDGVRDPGNLGTILRSAAAAGVQAVLLPPGNADAWAPKVMRAGMGAHFRIPILQAKWEEIESMLKRPGEGLWIYLATPGAELAYNQANFSSSVALIVGGEARGAGGEASSLADEKVSIPMPGGSESLNAAVAASILLFEVVRQRGSRPAH